jgi:GT2 family glycosyltransferase
MVHILWISEIDDHPHMQETSSPLISLIIVYWNSAKYLPRCLNCISLQTFSNFEVIIVDNGSRDGSLTGLAESRPAFDLHIERLNTNQGFAVANNTGARLARGQWLALLNADAFPEPDWLEKLLLSTEKHPEYSSFSSRQVQAHNPDLLDGAGDRYHISGLAWRNHYNLYSTKHGLKQEEVFSPCGAAALFSREEFLEAGGFDEDYFSYFEDVDLGFRLRLAGKKCLYIPEAVVHHVGSASTGKRSDFSVYYGYRNLIWTFVKDMPSPLIWVFLPLHIGAMLFSAILFTLRGQGTAIWKAIFDALVGLPKMIKKRKVIQKNNKIKAVDLLKVMSTGLFEPLQEFRHRNKKT